MPGAGCESAHTARLATPTIKITRSRCHSRAPTAAGVPSGNAESARPCGNRAKGNSCARRSSMLRRKYCEVCRDERQIRVPLYWPLKATDFSAVMGQDEEIKQTVRCCPCPECGPKEPLEKVAFIQFAKVIH